MTKATPTFGEPSAGTAGSFLTGGVETSGLVRGPAFQLFNNSGVLQTTQFALNPDFREVTFRLGNFDADAAEEILVGGRETTGLMRGSAYQIFDPDGTLKLTREWISAGAGDSGLGQERESSIYPVCFEPGLYRGDIYQDRYQQ